MAKIRAINLRSKLSKTRLINTRSIIWSPVLQRLLHAQRHRPSHWEMRRDLISHRSQSVLLREVLKQTPRAPYAHPTQQRRWWVRQPERTRQTRHDRGAS